VIRKEKVRITHIEFHGMSIPRTAAQRRSGPGRGSSAAAT
jgi:hypothetical protein